MNFNKAYKNFQNKMFETCSYLTVDSFKSPRSERAPTARVTGNRV